jgi:hypothetical protein
MKRIFGTTSYGCLTRLGILLAMLALAGGAIGCFSTPSQDLEIRDWNDLNAIRDNLTGHHILMNDLDSSTAGYAELAGPEANGGEGWQPIIGGGGNPSFTGTFDGQGYEIRDMFINLPGKGYVGVFSKLGEGGTIENVGVVDANVTATAHVGALVGASLGTVSNSYSTGSVAGDNYIGGLVGSNGGTVDNSYSTCDVSGLSPAGGLVAENTGTVSNSYSTGGVTADTTAGGLVAENTGTVSNSYSTGDVTADAGAGGLVANNGGTVTNSYATGSVAADDYPGGLIAYSNEGTASASFWDTETSGQPSSDGGTGETTAEMKNIATFSDAGWSIVAVTNSGMRNSSYTWNVVDGATYPFLSWQP